MNHVSYATWNFRQASALLRASARRFGLQGTRIYGPECDVVLELKRRFPETLFLSRGAGYWVWKPHVILDALNRTEDGDAVLYTDAAMTFVSDPSPLLGLARDYPVVLFEMTPPKPQAHWTKRDCFILLDADGPEHWDAPQLWAGCQLYRACPEARGFVAAVCAAMEDLRVVTDLPNQLGEPNLPGFNDHRHDQSVLTILAKKSGVPSFPDPTQWGPWNGDAAWAASADGTSRPPVPYGQTFHLHRRQDVGLLRHAWLRVTRSYTGGSHLL